MQPLHAQFSTRRIRRSYLDRYRDKQRYWCGVRAAAWQDEWVARDERVGHSRQPAKGSLVWQVWSTSSLSGNSGTANGYKLLRRGPIFSTMTDQRSVGPPQQSIRSHQHGGSCPEGSALLGPSNVPQQVLSIDPTHSDATMATPKRALRIVCRMLVASWS